MQVLEDLALPITFLHCVSTTRLAEEAQQRMLH